MKQTVPYYYKHQHPQFLKYGYYFKSGLFAQYVTKEPYNHYSDKHWKIHINYPVYATEEVKSEFLKTILGFLKKYDINHKIVIYEQNIIYRMNRVNPDNSQNGKIITIYCRNDWECWWAMDQLDKLIIENGFINYPLRPEQHFRNDHLFRNNPYIGYRYASTPRKPFYVIPYDRNGREIEDIQEKFKTNNLVPN